MELQKLPSGALVRLPATWLEYQIQMESRYFLTIQLQDMIARCLQIAYDRNTSAAIRDLRQQLSLQPL